MRREDAYWCGTTASAISVEGVHPAADWSAWERDKRVPRSNDGNGFLTNFHDDLALIASLGVTDIRITLEWARIEPSKDKIDGEALDRYDDILRAALSAGLRPWATLQHTSLPGWFSDDEGGLRDDKAREYLWIRQVDRCAERFGESVHGWTPIEDPVGWALRGYALGSRPPGRRRSAPVDHEVFLESIEAALIADHLAARHLKAGGATTMSSRNTPTIFRVVDDPTSQLEADAAAKEVRWWAQVLFDTWVGMAANGELVVPGLRARQDERWVGDFDILGLGFDAPTGIDARGGLRPYPEDAARSDTGFSPLPEELGVQLRRLSERLPDHDLAVTANGIATTNDGWRTEVLGETLDVLDGVAEDGVRLVGYFHDTAIDGYEWRAGFETERGLIGRDRAVKESGLLLSERLGGTAG
ncbi:MAG: family 1 glycosylhydrolase [Actinomycetota bacterium]